MEFLENYQKNEIDLAFDYITTKLEIDKPYKIKDERQKDILIKLLGEGSIPNLEISADYKTFKLCSLPIKFKLCNV